MPIWLEGETLYASLPCSSETRINIVTNLRSGGWMIEIHESKSGASLERAYSTTLDGAIRNLLNNIELCRYGNDRDYLLGLVAQAVELNELLWFGV